MDIGKLKNNRKYYEIGEEWAEPEVILSIKENPEFNLHIWDGYFVKIFGEPIFTDKMWVGFTRDYQEGINGWDEATEMDNIDEYIWDMLRYKGRNFLWEEIPEVFDLVIDFLTYAKQTGQTVIVEVS